MARIYKIINDINDKIYVGQTHKSIYERFNRHCRESVWKNTKKMPIILAIKKYGKQHFSVLLLEELSEIASQIDIDNKEIEWGLKLNSLSPNGYNLKLGNGNGIISEETKRKLSKSNLGKIRSKETKLNLSLSHIGYKRSEESKQKQSNTLKGKRPHKNTQLGASKKNSKTYILKNLSGEIITITNMKKFCQQNNLYRSNMSLLCTGKLKSHNGWVLINNLGFNK